MRILIRILAASTLSLTLIAGASSAKTFGPRLEGFDYPYPIQIHSLTTQGQSLEMAYMDVAPTGPANGRTAVLLHGKNFCGATWEETIATLSRAGYRVVAIDQIGFCKSSKPAAYQFSLSQLAANTHDLLKALKVDKVTLIGHSMGGMLATRFSLSYPDSVAQLVLVNPIGLEDWQALGVPYATIDQLYAGELKTNFDSIKAYQLKFYYNNQWKPEYDQWVDMQAGMYAGAGRNEVAYIQAQTSEMIFTQPIAHEFGQLKVPVTLMIGELDRTAPGANRAEPALREQLGNYPVLGKQVAQTIPNSRLITFPDLGHSPQVEAPDRFHKALLEALNE
ncbi:MAG: alpha/beta hydrolase [Asticcacaulis sp.]